MKRRISVIIAVLMMIIAVCGCLCACGIDRVPSRTPSTENPPSVGDDEGDGDDGGEGEDEGDGGSSDTQTVQVVYVKIKTPVNESTRTMTKLTTIDDTTIYSLTVNLNAGDVVTIYDNNNKYYTDYTGGFNGTATKSGNHTFELRVSKMSGVINVTEPQGSTPTTPTTPTGNTTSNAAVSTRTTVFYTNSEGWSNVYAYIWNYATDTPKVKWPGERLNHIGVSNGERQYSVQVDYSQYDRIIFNDGNGNQTQNLIIGHAVSGYYGRDGIFTMGKSDYGKVEYTTLTDAKNLTYLPSKSKKISVYTPSGYTASKKYGVLYMFDSQNLYIGATGAQVPKNSWAVDVAINNLVANGGDGVIIVAIDNTDGHRDQELTMSRSFGTITSLGAPQYGDFYNGKLDELGNFMKETLMPWVSSHYSVDTSVSKTGIAGSSSGGLAAYYLGLRDNDLYGYIGAFSPANGIFTRDDWKRFYQRKNFANSNKPKIYVYCGSGTWLEDQLLPATKQIKDLTSYGYSASDITEYYLDNADHNETYWRIAFTDFAGKLIP